MHGGTPLTRVLLCEEARLRLGLPALLVDPALDRDQAVTLVLSGRADLVGVPPEAARDWASEPAPDAAITTREVTDAQPDQ